MSIGNRHEAEAPLTSSCRLLARSLSPSSDPFGSLLSLSGSIVPLPLVAIPMVYHSKRQHPKGATNEMPSLHITKAERARTHTLSRLEKARACVTIHGHVLLYVEIQ
jgi:hypothetical protein